MKQSIITLALAASLLFNVFFIVGYMRANAGAAPMNIEQVAGDDAPDIADSDLELTDDQRKELRLLRNSYYEARRLFELSLRLIEEELLAELQKPQPDAKTIEDIVERQSDLHRQQRHDEISRFGKFMKVLTNEQRDRMLAHYSKRGHSQERRQRWLEMKKQFDTDGDGELSESEHDAMRRHFQEERRRKLIEEFDTNGDGTLDEQEEADIPPGRRGWGSDRRERNGGKDRQDRRAKDRDLNFTTVLIESLSGENESTDTPFEQTTAPSLVDLDEAFRVLHI